MTITIKGEMYYTIQKSIWKVICDTLEIEPTYIDQYTIKKLNMDDQYILTHDSIKELSDKTGIRLGALTTPDTEHIFCHIFKKVNILYENKTEFSTESKILMNKNRIYSQGLRSCLFSMIDDYEKKYSFYPIHVPNENVYNGLTSKQALEVFDMEQLKGLSDVGEHLGSKYFHLRQVIENMGFIVIEEDKENGVIDENQYLGSLYNKKEWPIIQLNPHIKETKTKIKLLLKLIQFYFDNRQNKGCDDAWHVVNSNEFIKDVEFYNKLNIESHIDFGSKDKVELTDDEKNMNQVFAEMGTIYSRMLRCIETFIKWRQFNAYSGKFWTAYYDIVNYIDEHLTPYIANISESNGDYFRIG